MRMRHRPLLSAAVAALLAATAAHASEVTIYRCTDAKGHLTLRDTPCRAGEKQEARTMVRPRDPPARPAAAAVAPAPTAPREPAPRYVVVTPPQPLYECITPDGERYTSETGEGRARWRSLWTMGYPVYPHRRDPYNGGYNARVDYRSDKVSGSVRVGDPHRHRPPAPVVPVYPTGQWVRDECYRLPQQDICGRLRDERHDLNRRWNIAQPSERAQIDRETRRIDARLGNDCGGY